MPFSMPLIHTEKVVCVLPRCHDIAAYELRRDAATAAAAASLFAIALNASRFFRYFATGFAAAAPLTRHCHTAY